MHWLALQWRSPETDGFAAAVPTGIDIAAPEDDRPSPGSASRSQSDALPSAPLPSAEVLGWWALQFTPHVAWVDEALLLEVSACERFWGGRRGLLSRVRALDPAPALVQRAQGATSLIAMARLRLRQCGERPPADISAALPLHTLTAARPHLYILERMGCRTWGDVAALPRAGVSRRFGPALRQALDRAWGLHPDAYRWLELPESFDRKVELRALALHAPELLWAATGLLADLQIWLRGRQRGVLAIELQWTLDLRRVEGVALPPHESLVLRTARPVQDMGHLKRLLGERLDRTRMAAPASWLRLRSLDTAPLVGASASFLPDDSRKGDRLHELVERLTERLGAGSVLTPVAQADHRPEHMQRWEPAAGRLAELAAAFGTPAVPAGAGRPAPTGSLRRKKRALAEASDGPPDGMPAEAAAVDSATTTGGMVAEESARRAAPRASPPAALQPDSLYPPWLLPRPLRLELQEGIPCWRGRLRLLAGPQRVEAGWWAVPEPSGDLYGDDSLDASAAVARDYYIAESPSAGLVWVFRERPHGAAAAPGAPAVWFLHGLYA